MAGSMDFCITRLRYCVNYKNATDDNDDVLIVEDLSSHEEKKEMVKFSCVNKA